MNINESTVYTYICTSFQRRLLCIQNIKIVVLLAAIWMNINSNIPLQTQC